MAIESFADQITTDIYNGLNSKASRRVPQDAWKSAQRKLSVLHNAKSTQDLTLPGLHFEPLKHDRPGFNSIRVNDRYRVIFRFIEGHAYDVSIEDFHGRHQS